ncbi:chitosanase [Streptomyces nodosus]|uniref:Chitosanase n=1 Tax=Streptomyces nodosus TaxID=40318 RepID=A0A0B5DHT9_9ACTN|nr:chitosanase [Streptomyces nodosus]AJE39572.1 chitosanase [Streptomyces nodosus]MBB4790527.1 chitosanase [Streptomyces nodosus]QEV38156.1 chitosanase [Streptomyces nodosus]
MKRAGCLLFAALPVLATAAVYVFTVARSDDSGTERPTSVSRASGEEAKARAERAADDKAIAHLPPGLAAPAQKELAQQIVASSENSTLDWRSTYGTVEDSGDGDGYTAGIIGFCTGTHDLLVLVERYTKDHPDNGLARYLPALRTVDGTDSHEGLDPGFPAAWKAEAEVPAFREAQEEERDRVYFDPAVRLAKLDGLGTLGQFIYYDAMVHHGPDTGPNGFYGLRERALKEADTPSGGGDEKTYLDIFLDIRREAMVTKKADRDTTRIDTAQRQWLYDGNLKLATPLVWKVSGETYRVP